MGLLPVLPDPAENLVSRGREALRQGLGAGGEKLRGALNAGLRGRSELKTLKQKYPQVFGSSVSATTFMRLQRGYNWEFMLPDMDEITGQSVGLYCQDVSFGEYNISEIDVSKYGIFKRGYAGFLEIQTIKASFLCPIPDLISVYFGVWKSKIITNGLYHPKMQYSKMGTINLLDRVGKETSAGSMEQVVAKTYQITGMFPKTFPAHDLSYKEEGVEVFSVEFNVDNVELKGGN